MELLLNWLCIKYLHDLGKVNRDFLLLKRLKLEEFSIHSLLRQPVSGSKICNSFILGESFAY